MQDLSHKRFGYGAKFVVLAISIAVFLFFLNILAIQFNKRIDMTQKRFYTLSPHTIKVLKELKKKIRGHVKMIAFFETGYPDRERIEDLLRCYRLSSDILDIKVVDPDKNPGLTRRYGIRVYGVTVVSYGNKAIRVPGVSEQKITNALIRIMEERGKVVYFLQGHGEGSIDGLTKADYLTAVNALKNEGYIVRELRLYETGSIPEDCDVLVIDGPQKDLLDQEIRLINRFLKDGGAGLFMIDPGHCDNLVDFFKGWGVKLGKNEIVDPVSKLFGGDLTMPVVTSFQIRHEITKDFRLPVLFPGARTVGVLSTKKKGFKAIELAYTNPNCGAEVDFKTGRFIYDPGVDLKGALPVAVAVTSDGDGKKKKSRIVVIGDSDFATNAAIRFSGNRDFFVNIVNWLARREGLISIRPRAAESGDLSITQRTGNIYFFLSMVLLPLIIAMAGAVVWIKRRSL